MKFTVLIFVFSSLAAVYSQSQRLNDLPDWLFGVNISPDFAYRGLSTDSESDIQSVIINSRNQQEVAKIGFTGSFRAVYTLNKRFSLEGGFGYSNKGYRLSLDDFSSEQVNDPRRGGVESINEGALLNLKNTYSYHYVEAPIQMNATFGNGDLKFVSSLGIVANYMLSETVHRKLVFEDGTEFSSSNSSNFPYQKWNLSASIETGWWWFCQKGHVLKIAPVFRFGSLSITKAPIHENLWDIGLNVGYYFTLN